MRCEMGIHKEHYRQMIGVVERVHIAKLLMVQDLNLVGQYVGRKLSDIDVTGSK